jgi:hypothetical protein
MDVLGQVQGRQGAAKNVRDWLKAEAARQDKARSTALQESEGVQAQVCA